MKLRIMEVQLKLMLIWIAENNEALYPVTVTEWFITEDEYSDRKLGFHSNTINIFHLLL